VESDAPGSGGRAKRIYGRTRTVVADDEDTVSDVNKLEEALAKESYANLRSRYEVNGGEVDQGSNAVSVGISLHTTSYLGLTPIDLDTCASPPASERHAIKRRESPVHG
jgi:hypothetical protein